MRGRVVRVQSRAFSVSVEGGAVIEVIVPKKLRYENPEVVDPVVVGDWVFLDMDSSPPSVVSVEDRSNFLSRPASGRKGRLQVVAANIDHAVIVLAAKTPQWKTTTLDRYLVMASAGNVKPRVVINKIDLNPKTRFSPDLLNYSFLEDPILCTSAETGDGVEELARLLAGKTSVLIGPSGVGKSSLINTVDPTIDLRVGEVSERTKKGQHTTTWVEMIPLSGGGALIDSPGIRTLDLSGVEPHDLQDHFPELAKRSAGCKFSDCSHVSEPSCAVREALERGEIPQARYDSYVRIKESLEEGSG